MLLVLVESNQQEISMRNSTIPTKYNQTFTN